jgi:hypothetical protein
MIMRVWHGWTTEAKADAFELFLCEETPGDRRIPWHECVASGWPRRGRVHDQDLPQVLLLETGKILSAADHEKWRSDFGLADSAEKSVSSHSR